jgi:hypothetical protein
MPLIFLHVGELLQKISNGKPLQIGCIGLASPVDQMTLPASLVRPVFSFND